MKYGIKIKLDVSKIDKGQLYAGQKGTYLTVTGFIDVDNKDQYGNNGMITQEIAKELRDQGQKGAILGNAQVFWSGEGQQAGGFQQQPQQAPQQPQFQQQPQQPQGTAGYGQGGPTPQQPPMMEFDETNIPF